MEGYNSAYNVWVFKKTQDTPELAEKWFHKTINVSKKQATLEVENDYLKNIYIIEVKNNLFGYAYFHLNRSIRGILDPRFFDFMIFYKQNEDVILFTKKLYHNQLKFNEIVSNKYVVFVLFFIPILMVNILKYIFVSKFIVSMQNNLLLNYLLLLMAYYFLITGAVNCTKYMMPFHGIIILFALQGYQQYQKKRLTQIWKRK